MKQQRNWRFNAAQHRCSDRVHCDVRAGRPYLCRRSCTLYFRLPFTWIEEIQAAMIVWVIFGAAGAAFRTGNHAAIEVFFEFSPKR